MSTATLNNRPERIPMLEPESPVQKITVKQYDAMIRNGILSSDDKVELLNGYLVPKMPKGEPHESAVELLTAIFLKLLHPAYAVRCQNALRLSESEPEPDFVICNTIADRQGKHPGPNDSFIVVEVADSSLGRDHGLKLELYAKDRIPCYWIVDTVQNSVAVYLNPDPANGCYRNHTVYPLGSEVPVQVRGETLCTIPVAEIFPFTKSTAKR